MILAVLYLGPGVRPASIGLGFMVQSLATDDHRIAKMAQQVKDVLPHVPLNVIAKDLGKAQFESHVSAETLERTVPLCSPIIYCLLCCNKLCFVQSVCKASFKVSNMVCCLLIVYSKNQLC